MTHSAQVIPFAPRRRRTASQGRSPSVPGEPLPPVERTGTNDMPLSAAEIAEAGLYCHAHTTASDLVIVCGSQVRAGLAIDAWLRRNGKSIG